MTTIETRPETKATGDGLRARRRKQTLYLVGLTLIGFAALSLASTVFRAPAHSGAIDLAGQQVRVAVSMVPDPPKTGPIPLQVMITDSTGSPAAVDQVIVRYGMAERMSGEAIAASGASGGVYRAQIEFASVGRGWVEITVRRGNARGQLRLPVDVRPNI